jgi:hypothetical protein
MPRVLLKVTSVSHDAAVCVYKPKSLCKYLISNCGNEVLTEYSDLSTAKPVFNICQLHPKKN